MDDFIWVISLRETNQLKLLIKKTRIHYKDWNAEGLGGDGNEEKRECAPQGVGDSRASPPRVSPVQT